MQNQDDDTEKSFEPTPHKLQEARKKGDVPKSQDLNATASYLGLLIALYVMQGWLGGQSILSISHYISQPHRLAQAVFGGGSYNSAAYPVRDFVLVVTLFLGLPLSLIIVNLVLQRAITFAPDKIIPKLNRISVISNAKQKFGAAGLFEFLKSCLKLVIFSVALGIFLSTNMSRIVSTPMFGANMSVQFLVELLASFLVIIVTVSLAFGVIDFAFQHANHRKKLMMSRKEVQDEGKQQEGDPHFKNARRQRGRDIALSQTIEDVKQADVIITNPTHYAVALKWSREPGKAPECVAKGVDEMARVIRETAQEHAVPIMPDPPTARSLYATTEVGEEIPVSLYQAVATAIRFAEAVRQRKREQSW